jgi:hypothetical protein
MAAFSLLKNHILALKNCSIPYNYSSAKKYEKLYPFMGPADKKAKQQYEPRYFCIVSDL